MSQEDRKTLSEKVSIIFHLAATVKFDNPLGTSVSINVRGTKEVMDLARGMRHLASFVHCSSAYIHCHLEGKAIEEKIYPVDGFSVKEVLDMCDVTSIGETRRVVGMSKRPNVCHFTKVEFDR